MASILIMEDDFPLAQSYAEVLRKEGHSVSIAETGSDALLLCKQVRFDLAIVDIFVAQDGKMISDGGLTLIGRLRNPLNNTLFPLNAPILAISAARPFKTEASVLDIALSLGATEVMAKPVEMLDFVEMVSQHAERIDAH